MSTNTTTNTGNGGGLSKAKRATPAQAKQALTPPVDIYENAEELLLVMDMPGVPQEGLKISLEKRELLVEGRKARPDGEGKAAPADIEAVDYRRSFVLPQGIDSEKVSAELQSGVLRVHVPKAATVKPRQIPVKVS